MPPEAHSVFGYHTPSITLTRLTCADTHISVPGRLGQRFYALFGGARAFMNLYTHDFANLRAHSDLISCLRRWYAIKKYPDGYCGGAVGNNGADAV